MSKQKEHNGGTVLKEKQKQKFKKPPMYVVIFINDDYTTVDFVIEMLVSYFGKTEKNAENLALKVHHTGKAVAGLYTKDVAETKAITVMYNAKAKGYPLKLVIEVDN